MTIRRVTSPAAPEPPPERWSNCLLVDGIAYISGMVARGEGVNLAAMDEYEQATAPTHATFVKSQQRRKVPIIQKWSVLFTASTTPSSS